MNSLGRSKEALEEYKKALEVDPNNQDAVKRKEELEITKLKVILIRNQFVTR